MGRHLDSLLKRGFRATKCATLLKLTVSRIKLARNQKTNSAKQLRKEIAQLLQSGQESHAYRLKTEQLVRIQNFLGAYDLIEHYCKLVISRMQIIDTQRNCPLDVKEAVASLIFAAPRCTDLVDLPRVRDMFTAKYGKEFTTAVLELRPDHGVNAQIVELLSTRPATGQTKLKLMQEIAAENNIEWKGDNEFTKPPEDLPDKSGKLQPDSESSQTGLRRDQASTMVSMQSPKISPADSKDGEVHTGIPAGGTNLDAATADTGRVSSFGAQTIPAGIAIPPADGGAESVEGNVSYLPEYGQPLQASLETGSVSDSESDVEFQDAVEGNVSDSIEAAESKMGFQNAGEVGMSVMAGNDESIKGTSQRVDEDFANLGSRRRQFKDSASAAQAAFYHEDNVSNAEMEPSEKASSMSDEDTRMPSQRFYEDGANIGSGRRHYKDSASAGQAALPVEDDVPKTGTEFPPPSEKASLKSDEVLRMPSQKFYKDGVHLGSGKVRHFKDFASAAQVAFESAALAAEAAQAAMGLARFVDQESGSFKYSSFSNNLGAKAAATEIPKALPEFNSELFESSDPKKVTEEPKARPEFDSRVVESNVDPKKVTEEPKASPEIRRKVSDADTVYLDSFPSAVFTSAQKTGERSEGEITSSSDDDVGGISNPTWDSEDVSREKRSPAKSGSGYGYFKQKSSRISEGSADEAQGSDDDAMINPASLWNRRVAGARLATEDTYAERPKFDDEEDVPYAYGEHFGRNSLEKMNSGSESGEFSRFSSFSTRTQLGSSKQSSFSTGTFEEDGGGEKLRFERSRLPEDSLAAGRGREVFSHKPKFDDEVNDGQLDFGMGQFARVSSGHDREKADAEAAPAPSPVNEAWRRSEAKPRWSSSSSNVAEDIQYKQEKTAGYGDSREKADAAAAPAPSPVSEAWRRSEAKPRWSSSEDIQYEQKKTAGHGDSRRTTWAKRRPSISPPEAEQHDEVPAASATSRKNIAQVDGLDTKSYDRGSSSTKVAANDAALEAIGGGGSASAAATLPPSRQATKVANDAAVSSRRAPKVANDAAVASRRATKVAANDSAVEGGGGGSASFSAITLPPPSTHASSAAVYNLPSRQASAADVALPPSRQTTKVAANDTAVGSRRATKVTANDAPGEAGDDGRSASAAAVNLPPSTQASAAAVYFPPPPPTRPPPPAPTLQLPLTRSPSSLTSPLTPSFSDPVVLASTPPPPRTPSTASTSSSPVQPPHLSTAASAPPPAARDSPRAPHRHPKLPDYDDFVAHFEKLRQESRTSPLS